MRKEDVTEWMQQEMDRDEHHPPGETLLYPSLRRMQSDLLRASKVLFHKTPSPQAATPPNVTNPPDFDDTDDDEIPIDPQLLVGAEAMSNIVSGTNDEQIPAGLEEAMLEELQQENREPHNATVISPLEFVKKFSTINITNNQTVSKPSSLEKRITAEYYSGGSKDELSHWEFPCKNAQHGCTYQVKYLPQMRGHESGCKITSAEAKILLSKPYVCTYEGCASAFKNKQYLNMHVRDIHKWNPRQCSKEDCTDPTMFHNLYSYQKHMRDNHYNTIQGPARCRFPGVNPRQTLPNGANIKFTSSRPTILGVTLKTHTGSAMAFGGYCKSTFLTELSFVILGLITLASYTLYGCKIYRQKYFAKALRFLDRFVLIALASDMLCSFRFYRTILAMCNGEG
ncbi:uncharacterized protein KY384_008666 [Bacidia gigantensis]|uniref:uncharacterized protein n=1 Tax=Bacidia gigantensis TaxID=2732470 RepID=UPI001D04B009|nr:uncharacterized protein KY384_008666 [Bacidia gigantensis]KAG8526466.1 hypothetical protein KY384_008666 [Bacidia gigantensis]